ncbi:hypothetical protein C2I17_21095 [Niallia circulans]|uniref:hypothetical protein n=1 Tax=Niallia circulans TaxID=1397 RepID=UPI00201D8C65|nr:hypothetical protein [Niallia circulans]UQZ76838.1 hypothetical protein C2I17_21095 [Niallia circulans]
MRFTLLDNGADSLKGAYDSLKAFDNLYEGTGTDHNLKDAVIYLNHGLEILLKLILKNHSPSLMFSDIKAYQKAKEKMKKAGKNNVFEVDSTLHTVTLEEALKRVELLCDIEIPESLQAAIYYINKIRNQLMHFEVNLNSDELDELVKKLKVCYEESVEFLSIHIEYLEESIVLSRFEYTREDYENDQGEWLAEIRAEQDYYDEMMDALEDYHNH